MQYQLGDRVRVTDAVSVELADHTVRLSAGLVLEVLAARPGDVKVLDVDTAEGVWIPAKLVRAV